MLANAITTLRILLSPVVIYLLFIEIYGWAVLLYIFAAILDWLDGFVARTFNQMTKLGTLLDPIADKVLVLPLLAFLSFHGYLPWWISMVFIVRDLGISSFRVVKFLRGEISDAAIAITPSMAAKLKSALLFVALGFYLLHPAKMGYFCQFDLLSQCSLCGIAMILILVSTVLTLVSAFHYLKK